MGKQLFLGLWICDFKKANIAIKNPKKSLIKLESAGKFGPELINCALKNFSEKWTQFKLKLIKLKYILKSNRSKPINFSLAGLVQPSLVLWPAIPQEVMQLTLEYKDCTLKSVTCH